MLGEIEISHKPAVKYNFILFAWYERLSIITMKDVSFHDHFASSTSSSARHFMELLYRRNTNVPRLLLTVPRLSGIDENAVKFLLQRFMCCPELRYERAHSRPVFQLLLRGMNYDAMLQTQA